MHVLKLLSLLLILKLIFIQSSAIAQSSNKDSIAHDRPKIGLVLSGGGARGTAHIGVLRVLEELRVPIDYMAGASMGSIVGALYASGMTPDEIESILLAIDWQDAFNDKPPRRKLSFRRKLDDRNFLINYSIGIRNGKPTLPKAIIQGQKLDMHLKRLLLSVDGIQDFDNLPIPFHIVATDIETGEPVTLSSGDLATAVRASMAIPSVFSPIEYQGRLLIDGGVSKNLPVDVVKAMGADIIIAIDIAMPLKAREELLSLIEITDQVAGIYTRDNTNEQLILLDADDILITPDLGDLSTADFADSARAIPLGAKATRAVAERLRRLSFRDDAYQHYLANLRRCPYEPPVIDSIVLHNQSPASDKAILSILKTKAAAPLKHDVLFSDIDALYGLGYFERVTFDLKKQEEETQLEIDTLEKSWGPHYMRFGLNLEDDFQGNSSYNFLMSLLSTHINALGAEWKNEVQIGDHRRLFSEFWQPLDYRARYFVAPFVEAAARPVDVFYEGNQLAKYDIEYVSGGISLGRQLGTWGEFRIGTLRISGIAYSGVDDFLISNTTTSTTVPQFISNTNSTNGETSFTNIQFTEGAYFSSFIVDTLDSTSFPREGFGAVLGYEAFREELGASASTDVGHIFLINANSFGRHTMVLNLKAGSIQDNGTIYRRFPLGGFLNLSGYHRNELTGQHFLHGQVVYFAKLGGQTSSALGVPLYLGTSLEGGNVWEDRDDVDFDSLLPAGSIFFAADTYLGPLYLGYGKAEYNRESFYLYFGQAF